jgi:hypothetical protein
MTPRGMETLAVAVGLGLMILVTVAAVGGAVATTLARLGSVLPG